MDRKPIVKSVQMMTPDSAQRQVPGGKRTRGDSEASGAPSSVPAARASSSNAENGSPKRARTTRASSGSGSRGSREMEAKSQHDAPAFPKIAEFKPGQILGVELTNFQVCARGSYKFGPYLNLLVGPNGSGKSTVITAIFLLMNGEQKDTARTSSDDFIRIGCDEARATVWIRGATASSTTKISLFLERGMKPVYEINDKSADRAKVDQVTAEHHIQVNNRCQFLPQERVASFSAETAHQRLISTLESVGEQSMVSTLAKLINFGANVREHLESAGQNNSEIETLTAEREKQEVNVEKLRRLYEDKKELEVLKSMKVLIQHRDAQNDCSLAKNNLEQAKREEAEFQANNQPLFEAKSGLEKLGRDAAKADTKSQADSRQVTAQLNRLLAKIKEESLNTTMADITSLKADKAQSILDIKTAKGKLKAKRQEIDEVRKRIDHEAMLDAQKHVDAFNEEIRELEQKKDAAQRSLSPKEQQIASLDGQRNGLIQKKKRTQDERLKLCNAPHKVREAITLISENKHLFKQAVLPPPLLTIKIKPGAERHVNAVLNQFSLEMFICQCDQDFRALSNLFDSKGHNFRIVTSSSAWTPNPDLRRQLISLGFDGVLSDLIVDEAPVMNYLCTSNQLDKVPYATRPVSSDTESRIKSMPGLPVVRYVTPEHMVRLSKSRYGSRQVSETRNALFGNYQWVFKVSQSVQESNVEQEAQIEELTAKITEMRSQVEKLNEEAQEYQTQRLLKLGERKQHQDIVSKQKTCLSLVTSGEQEIEQLEAKFDKAKACLDGYADRERELAMGFSSRFSVCSSNQLSTQAAQIVPRALEFTKAKADICESKSGLKRVDYEVKSRMENIARRIRSLTEQLEVARKKVAALAPQMDELRQKLSSQELVDAEAKAATMSNQEIESAVAQLEASLALNENGESYEQAVKMLEQTVNRLEQLIAHREAANTRLSAAQRELDQLAPEFEAKTRTLVEGISEKYSEFFSRLGCTGMVELNAPALKFEEWGIEIKVSYREGESPRALSAKTQSGGEKAVATATYLMALQGYSKAPFFVVDEINQGMDNINERAVHKFIVETSCIHNPRQYFMVTPKLLPDLTYHPRMKILCHNSTVNIVNP